jgi:hypothetical protein
MAKYLVSYNDIFNDVELNGFKIMTDKEVEQFEALAESIGWVFTYPLTSGEEIEFSSGEELLSRLDFKEISNEEFKTLKKVFNGEFGTFIPEEFLESLIEDEDDAIDDEDDDSDDHYKDFDDQDDIY